jgi:hypothetical protein
MPQRNGQPRPCSAETWEDAELIWLHDPVKLALDASSESRKIPQNETPPMQLCLELGRRLLLAEFKFSDWILRRVESIRFERERSVSRTTSVEFVIPDDAPIFVTPDDRRLYLVPLSMMRRRTLVNFKMENEDGTRLPMLGMRTTQQLDASMLFAAAATVSPTLANNRRVRKLIGDVIAGDAQRVERAHRLFCKTPPSSVSPLAGRTLFSEVWHRLRQNFSLYVALDVEKGRHRILKLSFEEPTHWRLQHPKIIPDGEDAMRYKPGKRVPPPTRFSYYMLAKLGIFPTRFRLQIPAAENAASYHFEATAALGVRIVKASLLAGRPHEPTGHVSADRVVGHAATVGLHAVEIPSNSLCRVQLDLRVPARGWLTQLFTSCGVILGILVSVFLLWKHDLPSLMQDPQLSSVVVILVTASAATAVLVAERRFYGLPASMVTHLRAIGVISLSLPTVAAAYIVYEGRPPMSELDKHKIELAMGILSAGAAILFLMTALALVLSWHSARLSEARGSPWDMTIAEETEDTVFVHQRSNVNKNFLEALRQLKFNSPAIGIGSAEGWHERYHWTDTDQAAAERDLNELRATLDVPARHEYRQFLRCISCSSIKRCLDLAHE